jgi:catechol 2,3-dioxygenase-like lactoylglutathione lyase family enzyme
MISGGNATIYVSSMDNAVQFYSEVLGLKLMYRFGNEWAMVEAGPGLHIGLHPASATVPAPGTKGSMHVGLELDEPIEQVVARLKTKGVRFKSEIDRQPHGALILAEDPDGNPLYLRDAKGAVQPAEQEHAGTRA